MCKYGPEAHSVLFIFLPSRPPSHPLLSFLHLIFHDTQAVTKTFSSVSPLPVSLRQRLILNMTWLHWNPVLALLPPLKLWLQVVVGNIGCYMCNSISTPVIMIMEHGLLSTGPSFQPPFQD